MLLKRIYLNAVFHKTDQSYLENISFKNLVENTCIVIEILSYIRDNTLNVKKDVY